MPRTYLKKGVRPITMDRENLEKAFNPSGPPPTEAGFDPKSAVPLPSSLVDDSSE